MNYYFNILLFACFALVAHAQDIERKIIIENSHFYYTTVDKEFQIATLHTAKISETMKASKPLALPAGRNYNEPLNPFSWDISGSTMYAVNFLNHPLNDRNEALKRFALSSLQKWDSTVSIVDMMLKSVDQNTFTWNEPYMFALRRSNNLDNFYYDGIALHDSSYYMAVANKGEFTLWNYDGKKWTNSEVKQFPVNGYFTLFTFSQHLYMLKNSGEIYEVSMDTIMRIGKDPVSLYTNGFIIENRDDRTIKFMKHNHTNQTVPLNELIRKKAVGIFEDKNRK